MTNTVASGGAEAGRAQDGTGGDLVDALVVLADGDPVHAVRHQRDKVVAATEGSRRVFFAPDLFEPGPSGLALVERLFAAVQACRSTPAPVLADHYRRRVREAGAPGGLIAAVAEGLPADPAPAGADQRLAEILAFTRTLIERPIDGDRDALLRLPAAGLSTKAVVTLAQLIAFLSYQARLVAGLQALRAAAMARPDEHGTAAATGGTTTGGARPPIGPGGAPIDAAPVGIIRINGFTNESLGWRAWLDVVDLNAATPEQISVLEQSHPKAKVSDYYRLLVHQPRILRERSTAFNAIMYAPGGLPRPERELAATVVSRINGCVYCASVHAQRFEQLAKRSDAIVEVFEDPQTAGTTRRQRAIVRFAIDLTSRPQSVSGQDIDGLRAAGLSNLEILDLIHSVAIFAWANRLMQNLGEPVFPGDNGASG